MTGCAQQNNQTKNYYIISYGCQMNQYDSECLAGQLGAIGYLCTDDPEKADIILINTCCVRESAEKKIYGKIGEFKRLKTSNPNLIIGIAGCMAQKDQTSIFKKAPHVDIILGTHNIDQLLDLVHEKQVHNNKLIAVDHHERAASTFPAARDGKISAWVPIMYGCNNFCTYCIVPYVRGREQSRPVQDIVKEIQELSQQGFKEVTLLGQNVNSYGKDAGASADFAELLTIIDKEGGIERIRYMTSHPRDMNDNVIAAIQSSRHICEQFHLPVQSGSNAILKAMNRGYTTEDYSRLTAKIRSVFPQAALTTDLIVGFPGETDELFEETLQFIKTIRFDAAYTFLYSPRSGTPAATMPAQVPETVKKERLHRLMDVQNEISLEINKKLEGSCLEVLVEGPSKNDPDTMTGRTRTNKIVLWKATEQDLPGSLAMIKITHAQTWVLKGQRC
ncbi:MAG: tRNA ((37)-C2)-methylthiotransferase MiaB [Firmicutes bacterium]|nr:tRNA ((37)-C2)-methylthiotransferase MiaB [Bacillota bacterium]